MKSVELYKGTDRAREVRVPLYRKLHIEQSRPLHGWSRSIIEATIICSTMLIQHIKY